MSSESTGIELIRHDKIDDPNDPCECKFSLQHYPAKSPELNPAENVQNVLKHTAIPYVLKRDNIEWTGSWEDKVAIVETAIGVLTGGVIYPSYFHNVFAAFWSSESIILAVTMENCIQIDWREKVFLIIYSL
jgi:hypothetical protein